MCDTAASTSCSLPLADCKDAASLPDCPDLRSSVSFLVYVLKALFCAPSSPSGVDVLFAWGLSQQQVAQHALATTSAHASKALMKWALLYADACDE